MSMDDFPSDDLVSVVIPSFQQGAFIGEAIDSVLRQDIPTEIIVMDGGSTDETTDVINRYSEHLTYWESKPDGGQAAAINAGLARSTGRFFTWLNSDDLLLDGALRRLVDVLKTQPEAPAAYGKADNLDHATGRRFPVRVEPFDVDRLALRCIISQPACLMRRDAIEAIGGLDTSLAMTLDYDLWWRLYTRYGPLVFVDETVAINRLHRQTKTQSFRRRHYAEAIETVRKHYGRVPLKWWIYQPYAVWWKALTRRGG